MTVFVDTFALIAWLNPRDAAHGEVANYFESFAGQLITTEWVLVELADALSTAPARATAVAFLRAVRADALFEIIGYNPVVYQHGFDLFASRADKSWSLTDCISFAAMTERGLTDALTADHHFEQAGFQAVFSKHGQRSSSAISSASGSLTQGLGFVTYENHANKHVTIHVAGCTQVAKRGGEHKYGDGKYESHATYRDARRYAERTGLEPIIDCSYCNPQAN
jgi:predicted nucleic acid-binding protein